MEIEICSGFDGGISFCLTTVTQTQTHADVQREREQSEPDSSDKNEREDQFYNKAAEMVGDHCLSIL
jgi:hypothetical protein